MGREGPQTERGRTRIGSYPQWRCNGCRRELQPNLGCGRFPYHVMCKSRIEIAVEIRLTRTKDKESRDRQPRGDYAFEAALGLVRGQGDPASLRIEPSLQMFGLRYRRRGEKHVKSHVARLAPEWTNVEDPQNRLFKNPFVFGPANQRTPAGRARNSRNCTSLHRLSYPSGARAPSRQGEPRWFGGTLYACILASSRI